MSPSSDHNLPGFQFTELTAVGWDGKPVETVGKVFHRAPDGSVAKIDYAAGLSRFRMKALHAPTFDRMHHYLTTASPASFPVTGAPAAWTRVDDAARARAYRRLFADEHGTARTILPVPRAWMVGDVDGEPAPANDPTLGAGHRLAGAGRYIRTRLGLDHVRMIVMPTSSTGRDPGVINLRLFWLLDTMIDLSTTGRMWVRGIRRTTGLAIDPAVLLAGQPIYRTAPQFRDGIPDPVPAYARAGVILDGATDRAAIDWAQFAEIIAEVDRLERVAAGRDGGDWRGYADRNIGEEGFHEPTRAAIGKAITQGAGDDEIIDTLSAIIAARADPARRAHYTRQWLAATIRSLRRRDDAGRARTDALRSRFIRA
jgi:hypothetical protein